MEPSTRSLLLVTGAAIIALLAIVAFLVLHQGPPAITPLSTATSTEQTATTTASIPDNGTGTYRDVHYEIDIKLPSSSAIPAQSAASMQAWSKEVVDTFKATIVDSQKGIDELHARGEGTPATMSNLSLAVSYKTYQGAHTTSYVFTVASYTGGAHGYEDTKTFTFDAKTGAPIALKDLFTPSSSYLNTLSAQAHAKLPAVIAKQSGSSVESVDISMLNAGIAAKEESFQHWYIDKGNLVLVFPPYAVAAYALGTVTLPIPLTELKSALRPEYQ